MKAKLGTAMGLGLLLAPTAYSRPTPSHNERILELRLRDRTLLSEGILVLEEQGRRYLPSEELLRTLGFQVEALPERGLIRAKIFSDNFNFEVDLRNCRIRWLDALHEERTGNKCRDLLSYESDIFVSETLLLKILAARLSIDELKSLMVADFDRKPPIIEVREREQEHKLQALIRGQSNAAQEKSEIRESAGVLPALQGPRLDQRIQSSWGSAFRERSWSLAGDFWGQAHGVDMQYAYFWNSPAELSQTWQVSKEDPDRKIGGVLGLSRIAAGDVYIPTIDLVTDSRKLRGLVLSSFSLDAKSGERVRSFSGRASPNAYVELYHNGVLVEAQRANEFGDYLFTDLSLFPGSNSIELRFSGTQGERSSERHSYFISPDSTGDRNFVYLAAKGYDASTDITLFSQRSRLTDSLSLSGTLSRFVDDAATQTLFLQTQVHGSMRSVSWDLAGAVDDDGDWATQMQALAGWERVRLRTRWQHGDGHFSSPAFTGSSEDPLQNLFESSLSFPIWQQPSLGLRFGWRREQRKLRDVQELLLSQTISYRNYFLQHDLAFFPQTQDHSGKIVAEKGWGRWRLRGDTSYNSSQWSDARAGLNFRSHDLLWTGQISSGTSFLTHVSTHSISGGRDLGWSRLLANFETDSQRQWRTILSLELSLERDARGRKLRLRSRPSGAASSLSLLIFEDTNSNGLRDPGEAPMNGLRVLLNKSEWKERSSASGELFLHPLNPETLQTVQVHPLDLMKLGLQSEPKTFSFRNPARNNRVLEIGLIRVAEIEAYLVQDSNGAAAQPARYRGLVLKSLKNGQLRQTRSDREGYFLFDEIPSGRYQVLCESTKSEMLVTEIEVDASSENYIQLGKLHCPEVGK